MQLRIATFSLVLGLVAVEAGGAALASPNLALEHPLYLELARLRASGALPPYLGGLRPLTEARAQELRRAAGLAPDPLLVSDAERGAWLAPVHHLRMRGALVRDRLRPHSTEIHPRELVGGVAVSCEHQQGRACGDGAGLEWELDSAAGYGAWLAAVTRVRAVVGSGDHDPEASIDRAYASAELGPVALQFGRDVLVIGPSARTQAMWGDNAPPLDHLRVSTARPLPLIGAGGSVLRANALFFLGRLRDPQVFEGAMVDGTRVQLDLWDAVEVGLTHLIQFGGDGAPDYSLGDYVLEHVQHNAPSPMGLDFANHRISGDVAVSVPDLAGLRVYYELAAEDLRDEIGSMLRRDADHVLGVEIDRLAPRTGLLVELTSTGVRSHEHHVFTTGTTSAGRIVGNPLGPSSLAAFAGVRLDLADALVWPWLEIARQSSDTFLAGTGVITRLEDNPEEWRARAGARAALRLTSELRLDLRALAERVTTADFTPGRTRWNAAAEAVAVWSPAWRL